MLPLKFPNSDIRTKRRQRGGWAVSHGQPPYRVGHPRPGRGQGPCKGAAGCGQGQPAGAAPAAIPVASRGAGVGCRGGHPLVTTGPMMPSGDYDAW
ncbi:hypothetical protein GW17_00024833 [Ensete ventricosum]|nr:hypothetical protein GW17_00024833 [Ensete ventricosum]